MSGSKQQSQISSAQLKVRQLAFSVDGSAGTPAASGLDGFQVSSVVDNGTGDYTIILANPFGLAPQVLGIVATSTGVHSIEVTAKDIDRVTVNFFDETNTAIDADFDIALLGTDMDYTM